MRITANDCCLIVILRQSLGRWLSLERQLWHIPAKSPDLTDHIQMIMLVVLRSSRRMVTWRLAFCSNSCSGFWNLVVYIKALKSL